MRRRRKARDRSGDGRRRSTRCSSGSIRRRRISPTGSAHRANNKEVRSIGHDEDQHDRTITRVARRLRHRRGRQQPARARCPAYRASIFWSRRCATPSTTPGVKVTDIDGIICRGPDDIYSPSSADRRAARHQRALLDHARQWRRQPDPGGRARRHGDQGRPGDHGRLRLSAAIPGRARTPRRKRGVRNETRPDSQLRAGVRPGIRLFRRGRRARLRRHAPHASLRHDARSVRRTSRSRSANMRCAIPTRR